MIDKKFRNKLTLHLTLFVFFCIFAAAIFSVIIYLLIWLIVPHWIKVLTPISSVVFPLIFSSIVGTLLATFFSKKISTHVNIITHALREVSSGNFDIQLEPSKYEILNQVIEDFNKMVDELGSVQTLRDDFIANFSHEFKTPIVSIKGFAELLLDHNLAESERQEYLNIIIEESTRLSKLANNTLLISKLENQKLLTDKTTYALDEQIRQCVLLLEKDWLKKQIQVKVKLDTISYYGNKTLMQQVWINLLSNAIKFTPEGGVIKIASDLTEEEIIISIVDNGIGMPDEVRRNIFDKFYQANQKDVFGNGLGLTIAKRILELSNGQIKVHSTPNVGTTFNVILPYKS